MRFTFDVATGNSEFAGPSHLADRLHLMGYGQSLSVGLLGEPSVTVAQPYGNIRFTSGIRNKAIEGGTYTATDPLVENDNADANYGETGIAAAANIFVEKMAGYATYPDQGFVLHGSSAGRGGMSIAQLSKGVTYYDGLIEMVQAGFDLSQAASASFAYLATPFTHGEADQSAGTTRSAYKAALMKLASDIIADVGAITGQSWRPLMLTDQPASHLQYYDASGHASPFRPEIALALRDAGQASSDIYTVTPLYWGEYQDNVHLKNTSYQQLGKYYGRALAKLVRARQRGEGAPVLALDLKSAIWQGKVIDLQFNVPHGPIVFDASWITPTANKGFDLWSADGSTLQDIITDVSIRGPDRVRITTSSVAASGSRLSYGFGRSSMTTSGRTTGPRGQLRDSEGDVDNYLDVNGVNRRLDNWCLIFETIKP